mgnify:CR=1 FL=1
MGLFGKKKKESEVTWEDIEASMRAPQIPDDQAENIQTVGDAISYIEENAN